MITTTEKAIAILRGTSNGDRLSLDDLSITQAAVNNNLTDSGLAMFDDLYQQVVEDRYERSWTYGIEGLTRDQRGYVQWRGITVEHFSFFDAAQERAAAERLAERCRSLEARGFPVNWGNASGYTPFDDAPAGTPWVEAMLNFYTAFANSDGQCQWLILHLPDGHAVALSVGEGRTVLQHAANSVGSFGSYTLFHSLQNQGLQCIAEHLRTYDGFVERMDEAGITPESVHSVLNADHSGPLAEAAKHQQH